ncbi:MAG TPA: integrase [Phaeodactylibacter sp.]|nr:integrase [Phaeodactylibacter sp.]
MNKKTSLEKYLKSKLSASSVKIYLFEINHFIRFLGKEKAATASYQDVQKYMNWLRDNYDNVNTINLILYAIKHYFFYLIEVKKRKDHPCRFLNIKDRTKHQYQLQDFLKTKQLQKILESLNERKERYPILGIRNQVVMSLLVYQALRVQEMCALEVKNINLKKATIDIQPTPKTNARTLHLKPEQIMLIHCYLHEVRSKLLKVKTKKLIITKRGTAEKGEGIHYLVSTFRPLFLQKKLTPTTIRQSVIANLLASGNDLRIVQVFAGHKNPSTTEKYRQTNFEKLRSSIQKYHPLAKANQHPH